MPYIIMLIFNICKLTLTFARFPSRLNHFKRTTPRTVEQTALKQTPQTHHMRIVQLQYHQEAPIKIVIAMFGSIEWNFVNKM